jgi:NAD(P)-dependent dehydrogenase (short-subunit alcohol dehydrogenase family)
MTRTIVITGANRGLGLSLARAFVTAGDKVIGGCRNVPAATELAALGAEPLQLDMSNASSIASFAAAIGDRPIDVLVNSAGIDARAVGADDTNRGALTISTNAFEAVMRVNVTGPLLLVQHLAPNLRAAKGKIVNISSQVGSFEVAQRIGRDVSYATSKVALNMVTLKQSQALAPDGVVVIAMHPGFLRTDMGGPSGEMDPNDAATQIEKTISALTIEQTGHFLRWDGTTHPW